MGVCVFVDMKQGNERLTILFFVSMAALHKVNLGADAVVTYPGPFLLVLIRRGAPLFIESRPHDGSGFVVQAFTETERCVAFRYDDPDDTGNPPSLLRIVYEFPTDSPWLRAIDQQRETACILDLGDMDLPERVTVKEYVAGLPQEN